MKQSFYCGSETKSKGYNLCDVVTGIAAKNACSVRLGPSLGPSNVSLACYIQARCVLNHSNLLNYSNKRYTQSVGVGTVCFIQNRTGIAVSVENRYKLSNKYVASSGSSSYSCRHEVITHYNPMQSSIFHTIWFSKQNVKINLVRCILYLFIPSNMLQKCSI